MLIISSCEKRNSQATKVVIHADSLYGSMISDTIIYDVIIKNPNPDDAWTEECLKNLDQSGFMDSLFNLVYSKQAIAYDFYTHKPLKVTDIKRMESEDDFSRSNIGKIQFTEKWYFDGPTQQLQKEVISIVLGHELYTEEGLVRGYKPVFKLQLIH
jgi:hypothetical protein